MNVLETQRRPDSTPREAMHVGMKESVKVHHGKPC
jgi:hypothetical protein